MRSNSPQPAYRPVHGQRERVAGGNGGARKRDFAIAYRIAGDRALAEEIAQDAFLELWRARQPFASAEHVRFWLRRVAVHRALDALRRTKAQPICCAEAFDELPAPHSSQGASLPAPLASRVEDMLATLPPAMRAALVLRYGEDDMTPDEIAALLGAPIATVKSNLARGLQLLRRKARVSLKEIVRE